MDVILNALKCANCLEVLSQPVILPCSHNICKSHTQTSAEQIVCSKCGATHSNVGFLENAALSEMIRVQLSMFDFGPKHKETCKSCDELKKQLEKNEQILKDPDFFIHDSIDELRNMVLLKSEKLKFRIDEITQELLDNLDEYEQCCKVRSKLKGNDNKEFVKFSEEFKRISENAKRSVSEWSIVLNNLRVDENRWATIKVECDKMLDEMRENLKQMEESLLTKEFHYSKESIEKYFEKIDLHKNFVLKVDIRKKIENKLSLNPIDSLILDSSLSVRFIELCQFDVDNLNIELLYRGSRDGFEAKDFHSKCDHRPHTITIVQTTKGFILGGYTRSSWMSTMDYRDYWPENNVAFCSFLFSLINPFNKPFKCMLNDRLSKYDISCNISKGPSFGKIRSIGFCICASNISNNYVYPHIFNSYEKPRTIHDPNGIYFCDSVDFLVKEIEVYQLNKDK